jgi:hypothetical protein
VVTADDSMDGAAAVPGNDFSPPEWGQDLVSVPALKMGLGRYVSNPLTGYLMILRTRGRKSGEMRDAPLCYAIVGEYVYCVAGFGADAGTKRRA